MFEVTPDNAVEYLCERGHLAADVPARAEALAWGVSNVVLRIRPERGADFVVKQSREQLRTQAEWFSCLDRVHREMDLMKRLAPLLPGGVVPRVLFEERDDYLFGMEAVAADHSVWKADLLTGRADPDIARRCGEILARIHGGTAFREDDARAWGDREVFVQLRIDPFYRHVAVRVPALRGSLLSLVDETLATRLCLVHADFSPKNILIAGDRLALVDYETGHYGDPAFDLGFFLSHLMLKGVRAGTRCADFVALARTFWRAYVASFDPETWRRLDSAELERRSALHLAACMAARVDGKSPVDYLDAADRGLVRGVCLKLLHNPVRHPDDASDLVRDAVRRRNA